MTLGIYMVHSSMGQISLNSELSFKASKNIAYLSILSIHDLSGIELYQNYHRRLSQTVILLSKVQEMA